MLRYLILAIKRFFGFSRVEAQGTLILIFIMLIAISGSRFYIGKLKSKPYEDESEELAEWIAFIDASIEINTEPPFVEKHDYLPIPPESFTSKPPILEKDTLESQKEIVIRDLNTASLLDLQSVRGIGKVYSERIIKYRNQLGGFSHEDQLYEVYGLKEEAIKSIKESFEIQSPVRAIEINADSAKVLARHPYISYDLAWIIINYRKQHGDIKSADDLREIKALDQHTISRIEPYLK